MGLSSYITVFRGRVQVGIKSMMNTLDVKGEIIVGGVGGSAYTMDLKDPYTEDRGRYNYEQFHPWKKIAKGPAKLSADQLKGALWFKHTVNGVPILAKLPQVGKHIYQVEGLILQPDGVEKQFRLDNGHVITGFVAGDNKVVKTQSFKLGDRIRFGYEPLSAHTALLYDMKKIGDAPADFKLREGELLWRKEDLKLPLK